MPCSCDGYGPTPAEELKTEKQKVEHLEKSLCNAQSLIHKLLRYIDASPDWSLLPPDLRIRADEHIGLLLKHKRAEHEHDRATASRKMRDLEMYQKSEADELARASARADAEARQRQRAADEREAEYRQLREVALGRAPTDAELLG